jgi:hypothetical protein
MGIGYQETDRKVIDYDLWFDEETCQAFRGPRPKLHRDPRIVCLGAAQTFGRFVQRPYPQQVSDFLQVPVLNLGVSGAGPEFYLERPSLIRRIARAEIVIVQAMSARSVTAGCFKAQKGNKGVLSFVAGPHAGQPLLAQAAYQLLRDSEGEEAFFRQVRAVQAAWLEQYFELGRQIAGTKVFLWLSTKMPHEIPDVQASSVGTFPHFVTKSMVDQIEGMGFTVIHCCLEKMEPQILIDDRTGHVTEVFDKKRFPNRPTHLRSANTYYATPALHFLAARSLLEWNLQTT